jgi:hypothetical protein
MIEDKEQTLTSLAATVKGTPIFVSTDIALTDHNARVRRLEQDLELSRNDRGGLIKKTFNLMQCMEMLEVDAAWLKHSLKTSQETSVELRGMLHNMKVSRA